MAGLVCGEPLLLSLSVAPLLSFHRLCVVLAMTSQDSLERELENLMEQEQLAPPAKRLRGANLSES